MRETDKMRVPSGWREYTLAPNRKQKRKVDATDGANPLTWVQIQPYACLLLLDVEGRRVLAVSRNFVAPHVRPGVAQDRLPRGLQRCIENFWHGHRFSVWRSAAGDQAVWIQRTCHHLVVEIEPRLYSEAQSARSTRAPRRGTRSLAGLLEEVLKVMVELTGMSRAVLYRCLADGSCEVTGEFAKCADAIRYHGLRYPQTEISHEMRQAYLRLPYRYVQDVQADSVPVEFVASVAAEQLDLSGCICQQVAPCHRGYMAHRGIRSALFVPIVRERQLWGLFALHSENPSQVSLDTRRRVVEECRSYRSALIVDEMRSRMLFFDGFTDFFPCWLRRLRRGGSLDSIFADSFEVALSYFGSEGGLFRFGEFVYPAGLAQLSEDFLSLAAELKVKQPEGVLIADSVAELLPAFSHLYPVASGVIAISLRPTAQRAGVQLLFFRPEVRQVIRWGSRPDWVPGRAELHASVGIWHEMTEKRSEPWELHLRHAGQTLYAQARQEFNIA